MNSRFPSLRLSYSVVLTLYGEMEPPVVVKLNRRSSSYFDYPGVFALPLVGFRRVSCLSRVSSVYPALLREISLSKRLVDQARVSPPAFVNRLPCPAAFRSFEPNLYFLLDILLLATFTRS